jgi:hypothetical protein
VEELRTEEDRPLTTAAAADVRRTKALMASDVDGDAIFPPSLGLEGRRRSSSLAKFVTALSLFFALALLLRSLALDLRIFRLRMQQAQEEDDQIRRCWLVGDERDKTCNLASAPLPFFAFGSRKVRVEGRNFRDP